MKCVSRNFLKIGWVFLRKFHGEEINSGFIWYNREPLTYQFNGNLSSQNLDDLIGLRIFLTINLTISTKNWTSNRLKTNFKSKFGPMNFNLVKTIK